MNRLSSISLFAVALIACEIKAQNVYHLDVRQPNTQMLRDHLKLGGKNAQGDSYGFTSLYMEQNGKPVLPTIAEFHYSRYPDAYWDESLKKIKAAGIDIVATYVFWNVHEETEAVLVGLQEENHKFVQLCDSNGLKAIVRVGPFCHGEMRNGGLPDWLYGRPFNVRSNNARICTMSNVSYLGEIGKQLNGLLFKDGGPVIGFQIENELHHSAAPWAFSYPGQLPEWTIADEKRYLVLGPGGMKKEDSYAEVGRKHMAKLMELAHQAGLEAPLYTATGWGNAAIVEDATIPVTSAYPFPTWDKAAPSPLYLYKDLHAQRTTGRFPMGGAVSVVRRANWAGIQITYGRRPTIPARGIEALVTRKLGSGANAIGYYMFHGGATGAENCHT